MAGGVVPLITALLHSRAAGLNDPLRDRLLCETNGGVLKSIRAARTSFRQAVTDVLLGVVTMGNSMRMVLPSALVDSIDSRPS